MKKILSMILASAALLTACDLDKTPENQLPQEDIAADYAGVVRLRSGLYTGFRAAYNESSIILFDLQADYMHAIAGFSNTFGPVHKWIHNAADQDIEEAWHYYYRAIARCNFAIDTITKGLQFTPTEDEQEDIDWILGEAYLIRAILYHELAVRFCADYDVSTASNANTGLPLALTYDPNAKPGRSTLQKTYEQILSDIAEAEKLLYDEGWANATDLNVDCITALKARVYLQMDNYEKAAEFANELIGSGTYALAESAAELQSLWTYDEGDEVIFKFYTSTGELGSQFGYEMWYDNYSGLLTYGYYLMMPDYIPTQDCIDAYDEGDWRIPAYFQEARYFQATSRNYFVTYSDYYGFLKGGVLVKKYSGNPNLRTSSAWNYYNAFKVFRLSEMYLIAAEAAVQSGGDAATPLNELREHRGLEALPSVTLDDVKAERFREMLLEGTRMVDLKRWGDDLNRGESQVGGIYGYPDALVVEYADGPSASVTTIPASDYRFVWPIPDQEIFSNQVLRDQQNPGWQH